MNKLLAWKLTWIESGNEFSCIKGQQQKAGHTFRDVFDYQTSLLLSLENPTAHERDLQQMIPDCHLITEEYPKLNYLVKILNIKWIIQKKKPSYKILTPTGYYLGAF